MNLPEDPSEEMVLRACAPTQVASGCFLGRFTTGVPGFVSRAGAKWYMQRQEGAGTEAEARRRSKPAAHKPWLLRDGSEATHTGHVEGGLLGSQAAASYFLLVPDGEQLVAVPVKEWYNFKPMQRYATFTLDDAEKQMENPRIAFAANQARLKRFADQADERAAEEMQEDDEDDPAQEVKWEDDGGFESARDLQADENATKAQSKKAVKDDPDGPEGAEDWEHNEERADDDLEMGEEGGSDQDSPPNTSPRSEPNAAGASVLRAAGLAEKSPEPEDSSTSAEGEEEDLDAMADGMSRKGLRAPTPSTRSPTPPPQVLQAAQNKRKGRTPAAEPDAVKRARREPTPVSTTTTDTPTSAPPTGDTIDFNEQDIIAVLVKFGPQKIMEIINRLRIKKAIETLPEKKRQFLQIVKRVAQQVSQENKTMDLKPEFRPKG